MQIPQTKIDKISSFCIQMPTASFNSRFRIPARGSNWHSFQPTGDASPKHCSCPAGTNMVVSGIEGTVRTDPLRHLVKASNMFAGRLRRIPSLVAQVLPQQGCQLHVLSRRNASLLDCFWQAQLTMKSKSVPMTDACAGGPEDVGQAF